MLLDLAALLHYERSGWVTSRALLPPARIHDLIPAIDEAYSSQRRAVHRQKLRVIFGDAALAAADATGCDDDYERRLAQAPPGAIP